MDEVQHRQPRQTKSLLWNHKVSVFLEERCWQHTGEDAGTVEGRKGTLPAFRGGQGEYKLEMGMVLVVHFTFLVSDGMSCG